jgi:hypothetical protein
MKPEDILYEGPLRIVLEDTQTEQIVSYEDESPWHTASEFLWTKGNYSCNCNREIFFNLAAGLPEPSDDDEDGYGYCRGKGRYLVVGIYKDNRLIFTEDQVVSVVRRNNGRE